MVFEKYVLCLEGHFEMEIVVQVDFHFSSSNEGII